MFVSLQREREREEEEEGNYLLEGERDLLKKKKQHKEPY